MFWKVTWRQKVCQCLFKEKNQSWSLGVLLMCSVCTLFYHRFVHLGRIAHISLSNGPSVLSTQPKNITSHPRLSAMIKTTCVIIGFLSGLPNWAKLWLNFYSYKLRLLCSRLSVKREKEEKNLRPYVPSCPPSPALQKCLTLLHHVFP